MKSATKFLTASMLVGAFSCVNAAPILTVSQEGEEAAAKAEASFLASLQAGHFTEDFEHEDYSVGKQFETIDSVAGAGSFKMTLAGYGGICEPTCGDGLAVLDKDTSPFKGRFAVSGNNWLDSMDAQSLKILPTGGFNAMGFYITDPNDAGGRFTIGGVDFLFKDFEVFGSGGLPNGSLFYVSLYDETGLDALEIYSNNKDDGYGLDNVTVGTIAVTEPGTLALVGLGLLGVLLSFKRKQR